MKLPNFFAAWGCGSSSMSPRAPASATRSRAIARAWNLCEEVSRRLFPRYEAQDTEARIAELQKAGVPLTIAEDVAVLASDGRRSGNRTSGRGARLTDRSGGGRLFCCSVRQLDSTGCAGLQAELPAANIGIDLRCAGLWMTCSPDSGALAADALRDVDRSFDGNMRAQGAERRQALGEYTFRRTRAHEELPGRARTQWRAVDRQAQLWQIRNSRARRAVI